MRFFLSGAGLLGICPVHVWFKLQPEIWVEFSILPILIPLHWKTPSLSSSPCGPTLRLLVPLGKADGKVSVRVWSSRAMLWLWPAFKAKLKNRETQQVLDCSSKLRVLFIKLPAFVHSPEPSVCYFCLESVTVIGERVGGFRVHSFLLEEEPSSLILNTISNILAFKCYYFTLCFVFPTCPAFCIFLLLVTISFSVLFYLSSIVAT